MDGLRLRKLAYDTLKTYAVEPRRAIDSFLMAVRSDRALLFELIGYAPARDLALKYLESAVADMRNETEGGEAQGQNERRHELRSSPSAQSTNAGEQHRPGVNAGKSIAASPAPISDDRDAQFGFERLHEGRSPSSEAKPPIPLPKRGPVELKAIKESSPRSAFDSILLRDQGPIGDLRWSMIPRYIRDNVQEAAILRQVWASNPPSDPNARIRDFIPLREFDRMVQRAAQVTAEALQ